MEMKLWFLLGLTLPLSTSETITTPGTSAVTTEVPTTAISTEETGTPISTNSVTAPAPSTAGTESATSTNTVTASVPSTEGTGTGNPNPESQCKGIQDYEPCNTNITFDCSENSKCYCEDSKPFCRCNNGKDFWYTGENCEQRWSTVTFALVASLPGLGLAIIVGVTIHCVHHQKKKGLKDKTNSPTKEKAIPQASVTENRPSSPTAYQNPMFTSDMQGGPRLPPASARQSQETFPMAAQPSRPNRYVPGQPSRNSASYDNPYAESQHTKNPYEPQNRYDDYRRPTDSPNMTNGMTRGGMSGFSQPSLAVSPFGTPDYNGSRPLFPRAQVTRPY